MINKESIINEGMFFASDEPAGGVPNSKEPRSTKEIAEELTQGAQFAAEMIKKMREHRIKEIVNEIDSLDLKETAPILRQLGSKLEQHRDEHNGFAPREIFRETLQIGGKDSCAEVVVRQVDRDGKVTGFWLKQRGSAELGWEGKYQVVGCSLTDNEADEESVKARLAKEVFGVADPTRLENTQRLGQTLHSEAKDGRARACRTEVFALDVRGDYALSNRGEGWRLFTLSELDESVVDHHHNTLAWAADEQRVSTVDLREGYKPTKQFKVRFRVYAGAQNQGTERHLTVRAQTSQEAARKASTIANLPEYRKNGDRDDFWSYEIDDVIDMSARRSDNVGSSIDDLPNFGVRKDQD